MTIAREQPLRRRVLRPPSTKARKGLLVCGILAPLLYVATDILSTMLYEGYSYTDQTISELFAIGAPTRPLVLVLAPVYALLVYAFGAGIWASAGEKRALRFVAAGLIGKEVLGLVVTLFFPMHMRGVEGTLTDTMHGILTLVGNLFFLVAIGFGAAAFGKRFGLYSIATMVLIVVGGVLAGLYVPQMAAELPTPWMGLWERMDAYAYVLWMAVLAIALLRTRVERPEGGLGGRGHPMKIIKAFIKRHALLSYFALTFAISWGGILLVIGGPGAIPATQEQFETLLPIAILAMLAGPPLAGILLTGLVHGRAGLRDLFTRMTRWRVGARWYAVALLTAPLSMMAVLLALSLSSPEFLPGIFISDEKATLVLMGIVPGLAAGLLEELGWTGFAIPRMRLRYGVLSTGLIVGVLWGAWHILTNGLWASDVASGALSLSIFLPAYLFTFLVGQLLAYRLLMVWVYDHTGGSLLVAMVMHASLTASTFILQPLAISGVALLAVSLAYAVAAWVVVAAVVVAQGGHLSR